MPQDPPFGVIPEAGAMISSGTLNGVICAAMLNEVVVHLLDRCRELVRSPGRPG